VSAGSPDARELVRQRRSAVAFDGRSALDGAAFVAMLQTLLPVQSWPWDVLWWPPMIDLVLFVHRVSGLEPGLYLFERSADAPTLRSALGREFLDERPIPELPLVRLARGECRSLARRLSCDQDIAADGFFSLGMVAHFDRGLAAHGQAFYRQLFWESGLVGQMLYLEAEAAGARATGIGCFYDDAVHDVLALAGHAFQSLYHFTVGAPIDDRRLMTAPGYPWEDERVR
jgi:nitroreductase